MGASPPASGPGFRICPLCETGNLVFSGWYSARCPSCGCVPKAAFVKTLHQVVALPDTSGNFPQREGDEPAGAGPGRDPHSR